MSRRINIKADTTYKYLQVFNGILELTQREMLVLSKFIDFSESDNICSQDTKKKVADDMGIKDPNTLNNYVKRLKDKGAITKNKNGYIVSKLLQKSDVVVIQIET